MAADSQQSAIHSRQRLRTEDGGLPTDKNISVICYLSKCFYL